MRYFCVLLTMLCFCLFGCADELPHPMQVVEIMSQLETAVETEIPAEVLAAMKIQADVMSARVTNILAQTDEQWVEIQQYLIENNFADIDFHAQQKAFYTRYIDAGGIAIIGTDTVTDENFLGARDVILVMTSKHPELKERLLSKHGGFYMAIVADRDDVFDIPEYQLHPTRLNDDPSDDLWLSGTCTVGKGPRRPIWGGYCFAETEGVSRHRIFAHEFAHALEYEMDRLKPGFFERLIEISEKEAKPRGIDWPFYEYWAAGVEAWFYSIPPDGYEDFFQKFPLLAELLDEWFPRVRFPTYIEEYIKKQEEEQILGVEYWCETNNLTREECDEKIRSLFPGDE